MSKQPLLAAEEAEGIRELLECLVANAIEVRDQVSMMEAGIPLATFVCFS